MVGFSPLASAPLGDDGAPAGVSVSVSITGVAATGAVGSTSTVGSAVTSITGVTATGAAGSVVQLGVEVAVTGISTTGDVGDVTIQLSGYESIVPNQDPDYSPENPNQTPTWVTIAA